MKLTDADLKGFWEDRRSDDYRDLCRYMLQPFKKWLGERDLTEPEAKRYAKKRYKEPSSNNCFLAVVKSFANWKMKHLDPDSETYNRDHHTLDLIKGITRERVVKRIEKKGLEMEELKGVLERCRKDLSFAVVWLLHWTGSRPIELVSLTPKMANFSECSLKFTTAKTKVEREIFFDDFTAKQLRIFFDAKPTYMAVYRTCKGLGIIPKSGRQTFRSLQPGRIDWTPPVRVHELIDLWCGHQTQAMDAVYSDIRPHLRRLSDVHFMKSLEDSFRG